MSDVTGTRDTRPDETDDCRDNRRDDADAATRVKHPADAREDASTRVHTGRAEGVAEPVESRSDPADDGATVVRPNPGEDDSSEDHAGNDDAGDEATRLKPSDVAPEDAETELGPGGSATEVIDEASDKGRDRPVESGAGSAGKATAAGLGVGSLLRQRFRIESVLGEGGMGTVFGAVDLLKQEARDEQVHVALKVMKPDIVDAEMTFMGLQREARRAQQLAHPNIVTVYDFDRADGHIYMTMEYLRGRPVSDLLKQNRLGMDPEQARDITLQIGAGLAYAHDEGIVHVDLKPQNVFMLDSGRVKILDFGIAKAYQEKRQDRVEDAFSGYSPAFASPQIIRRQRPTPRDDVFALGIMVYALFTGKHPFDWKSADQAEADGLRPARSPVFRRSEWRAVQAALAFDADARPADAGDFVKRFAPSKVKRAAIAVSVSSVAAALAFVLLFQPSPGPEVPFDQLDPALQARIETELTDAAAFAELGDLDSALQLYQGVLTLHPGNRRATRGMTDAVDEALQRIGRLHREGALSPAAARTNMEAMLAYDSLPAGARERVEQAASEL